MYSLVYPPRSYTDEVYSSIEARDDNAKRCNYNVSVDQFKSPPRLQGVMGRKQAQLSSLSTTSADPLQHVR